MQLAGFPQASLGRCRGPEPAVALALVEKENLKVVGGWVLNFTLAHLSQNGRGMNSIHSGFVERDATGSIRYVLRL